MKTRTGSLNRQRIVRMAGIAALLLLVILPLLPPLQAGFARWIGSRIDGLELRFDYLSIGPWGGRIRNFHLSMPGLELAAAEVAVDLAAWSSLAGFKLDIASAAGSEINVQIEPDAWPESSESPEPAASFAGLGQLLQLPRWLVLRRLAVDGNVSLISTEQPRLDGPVSLQLENLQRDAAASAQVQAELAASRGDALLATLHLEATVAGDIADDGALPRANAALRLTPTQVDRAGRFLRAELELALAGDKENLSLVVDSAARARMVEAGAVYDTGARTIALDWHATIGPGMIAAFMQDGGSADITGTSSGQGLVELNKPWMVLESTTRLRGAGWDAFDPRLAGWGQLLFNADIHAGGWGERWRARQFDLGLFAGSMERELLRIDTLQQALFDFAAPAVEPEQWGEPALRLRLDRMPLAWLKVFDPAQVFEGGEVSGALDIVPEEKGHFRLDALEPILASEIQLKAGKRGPMPALNIELIPHAHIQDGKLVARIDKLAIASESGLDVVFEGRADSSVKTWPVIDFEGGVVLRAPFLQRNIRELDALRGVARVQLDLDRQVLGIQTAGIDARSTRDTSYMALELKGDSPLELTLPDWVPDWDNYEPQQLVLRLQGLPIEWLGHYMPEIELHAGQAYGELKAVATPGKGFHVESPRPFEIRGVEPYYRGMRLFRDLSVGMSPSASLRTEGGSFALEAIKLRSKVGDRLDGEIKLNWRRDNSDSIAMAMNFLGVFPSFTREVGQLGALRWTQNGSIDRLTGETVIDRLELSFSDAAGAGFMEIRNVHPFSITSDPLAFASSAGLDNVLLASVKPLELQRLLPELGGLSLEGVLPKGEFYGRVDQAGRMVLAADDPLLFRDVTVRWEGAPLFEGLTIGLDYEVAYSASGLEARSVEMRAHTSAGAQLGEVSLQAVAPLTDQKMLQSLDVSLQLALASLDAQPLLDGLPPFLAGTLGGDLRLINDDLPLVRAQAKLLDAQVEGQGRLPELDFALALDGVRGQRLAAKMPLRMRSDRGLSSLDFTGEVVRREDSFHFDAVLAGSQIIMPDLRRFVEYLVPEDPPGEQEEVESSGEDSERAPDRRISRTAVQQLRQRRDERPFWSDRLSGQAAIDIGRLQFPHYAVQEIRGQLQLTPADLTLSGIEAAMLDARLSSSGDIRFDAARPEPYDMSFRLELTELQLAELLRSAEPDTPPVAEGLFSLSTGLDAVGRNALDLALASQGEIHLSGRDGVFRGLAGRGGAASTAAGVVGTLTFSRELKAIGRILDQLESLQFSKLSASLVRESPQRLEMRGFDLLAPQMHLQGEGQVVLEKQGRLLDSPFSASVEMATNQDMTILFDGMGLLEKDPDALGYRSLSRPLQIDGTLSEPDTSDLWQMLDEAADNARGFFGMGLRTINRKIKKEQARAAAE